MADQEIDIDEIEKNRRDRLEELLRGTKKCKCRSTKKCECGKLNKMKPKLYTAAKEANIDAFIGALEDYLGDRISIDNIFYELSPGWNSLLHIAATNVKEDIVKAIINFFPDHLVSKKNHKGDTALHIAAGAGATETVKLIIRHGGSLQMTNSSGNTPLHEAVRNKHCQLFEHLVDAKTLCAENQQGKSPLYLAVETGEVEVLKHLLNLPIEGDAPTNVEGMSPIHAAVMHRRKDLMEAIWEEKQGWWQWLFELKDAKGGTPLHLASYSNYREGVEFLIKNIPASAFEYDKEGHFPIHVACKMDHIEVIKMLLRQWPDPTEFQTREDRQSILHVSAKHGSTAAVTYILRDLSLEQLINETAGRGNSALHLAAMNWEPAALLLLARDQRVNHELVNMNNLTALDFVADNMNGIDEPFVKRLTAIILASAGKAKGNKDLAICKPIGQDLPKELEPSDLDKLKQAAETRMVVVTLVAAMTFAAGFTVPGGFSGRSDPDAGMSILLNKTMFQVFVVCNTFAMYSSIIALVILLWAQINDPYVVRYTLKKVRGPLLFSLVNMSGAFMAGVYLTTSKLAWLSTLVLIVGIVALVIVLAFYLLVYVDLGYTNIPLLLPFLDVIIVLGISMSRSRRRALKTHVPLIRLYLDVIIVFCISMWRSRRRASKTPTAHEESNCSPPGPVRYMEFSGIVKLNADPGPSHPLPFASASVPFSPNPSRQSLALQSTERHHNFHDRSETKIADGT